MSRTSDLVQLNLKLSNASLGPLHLLYLMAIYQGDFDVRLHQGQYVNASKGDNRYCQCIAHLLDLELIRYNGVHYMTVRGNAYVQSLLAVKVKA